MIVNIIALTARPMRGEKWKTVENGVSDCATNFPTFQDTRMLESHVE